MKLNRKTLRRMILKEIKSALLMEAEEVRDIKGNKILNPSLYSSEELEFLKKNPNVFGRASDVFPPDSVDDSDFEDALDREAQIDRSLKVKPLSDYSQKDLERLRGKVKGTHFSDIYDEDVTSIDSFLDDI